MSKRNTLDQYYTNPEYAAYLCGIIHSKCKTKNFIEPSAGSGAFSKNFESITSYDIHPMFDGCIEKDFLSIEPSSFPNSLTFVGNPPFGKNSSVAVKFFNHCAVKCDYICFILPKTFKKIFFKDKLNSSMHLVFEVDCPENAFILDGETWDVPCVFQIWQKSSVQREKTYLGPNRWFIQSNEKDYDVAVRRAGGNAGKVLTDRDSLTPSSTYFLKSKVEYLDVYIRNIYSELKEEASKTAGVRSLSLRELQYILDMNY